MKPFMNDDFLLQTITAKKLFNNFAKDLPIYDYHCHLDVKEIFDDKHFKNLTEMWLYGDHYKWRFMRSMGVEEKYCTGTASDYEKFLAYAKCIQFAVGNPLYHWTHLELQRYFGIFTPLTEGSAKEIWEAANAVISSPDFSVKNLIKKSNVYLIGTTNDPIEALEYHKALADDNSFTTKVVPTFRPDNALNIDKKEFADYISKLAISADMKIKTFNDLKAALSQRLDVFESVGSKISDHSLTYLPNIRCSDDEVNHILKQALSGELIDLVETEKFKTALLFFLGKEYARRGFVMQLHLGALRNNNTNVFNEKGPDMGFDSIDDNKQAYKLSKFMDSLEKENSLPKTILYSLNPNDNYVLGTMLGNFQQGGIKGKIQLGSAWWFNDHIDGMTKQIKDLAALGALSAFVGMLTDSRSFLSYPRHEYFRRILCNIIGDWVENGEFADDSKVLSNIVSGICFNNAFKYFGM